MERGHRPVYSTAQGRLCPKCGWPADDCRCAAKLEQPVPERPGEIVAKLRLEKSGRGGKTVTVVEGLPRNARFLEELVRELKRALGTGGTAREEGVEIQGDRRERLRALLAARGWRVKG